MNNLPKQNTPEWLEFRKNKIGASDIPIIMGLSPYSTPLQLWKRKLGFLEEMQMNDCMRFGNENESIIRHKVSDALNMKLDDFYIILKC